jgi:GNAT superfamily N-acetyltransferase
MPYSTSQPDENDTLAFGYAPQTVLDRYDIRDLRLFIGRDLRSLLEEEARVWRERLRWNYTQSIELLLSYLDSRILPGFVAVERSTGTVKGYCFSVYETHKAVVGDVFAIGDEARELEILLLNHLLPMLQHTPGVDRVESQLLLESDTLQGPFEEYGFAMHRRLFMEVDLPDMRELLSENGLVRRPDEPLPALPASLKLVRWTPVHYQPAGELIHRCYQHHGDSNINDQYRSVQGSLRFLHNIVRFPGCGVFDPENSFVVRDERSAQLEAVVLVSRVEPDVAHITQICIAPRRRGYGMGRMLLRHVATQLAAKGINAITLTVTESNTPALKLYQSLGFRERLSFCANVWTRTHS